MSNREQAIRSIKCGGKYPYDSLPESPDWAHDAARGILYDLCDRRGIKHGFSEVDEDVRLEIVESMAEIIRASHEVQP